ncbi:WD repeat-containing protein Grip71 [Haematobia irritans]|uniref:WD repeat-containing protein Grip71 n=1 Tax=Haematobia irritans TaxID=7368 RepID=UPI003F505694
MFLVSTAKTTILSDFNDLETKSTYQHANGESTDFQFYAQQRIFVEVNKKSGLEVMRVKEKDKGQTMNLQRVRKLNIDNVYCVACAKQSMEEMAVGLSNGHVKLYNYAKTEYVHKFNADSNRNSVLYLDYNASDEYIASVFENGSINIYGIRTKTKIDTFNIDSNSTLARFHPTKRFQLSIASYKGAVTIYDVYAKRKVFHAADAHGAQCRDLCMSPANPDTLISVGYDCTINIFDTRRKVKPVQISYCHPLSTVAASECGNYMCVGNLKGELTTYDMRNTKMFLSSKKVHDVGVTRVAFVPLPSENSSQSFSSTGVGETSAITPSGVVGNKSIVQGVAETTRSHRDSFCDFLDFHANRGQEKISPRFVPRRDSFDWESLSRKPISDDSRLSLMGKGNGIGGPNISAIQSDSFDARANTSDFLKVPLNRSRSPLSPAGKLSQIKEEERNAQDSGQDTTGESSDKENPQNEINFATARLKPLPVNFNSTPNRTSMGGILTSSNQRLAASNIVPTIRHQGSTTTNVNTNDSGVQHAINELRTEMLERFKQLEFEMKLQSETNKWQIFTQNFNLWNQRSDLIEDIRDSLGVLLQTDPFVNEFLRLKEENELLRHQLQMAKEKE